MYISGFVILTEDYSGDVPYNVVLFVACVNYFHFVDCVVVVFLDNCLIYYVGR